MRWLDQNFRGGLIDKFELVVKGPFLNEVSVAFLFAIELNNLRVPSGVIDLSPSDLNILAFPSRDLVHDFPSLLHIRLFKTSIDNDVFSGFFLKKFDIVDGQPKAVLFARSLESELIISFININPDVLLVNVVIGRNNFGYFISVPEDKALACVKSLLLSASVFKLKCVGSDCCW